MIKTSRPESKRPNVRKAREALRKMRQRNLPERFHGMSKEQIVQEIKKTREDIWKGA